MAPSQIMNQNPSQSQSYQAMRMSHQGFTPGTMGNNGQAVGLNSSLVVSHDLNNSLEFPQGLNNTAGVINRPGS